MAEREFEARGRIVVLTGAGISADSGVRTFRDAGGLWEGHRPEDVATPKAWARDRKLVWRFYQERRAQLPTVAPNPAHLALAEFERRLARSGFELTLITQNVDDLHERAGSHALHMHGELSVLRCERCDARLRDLERLDPERFAECRECGYEAMRPDVVWFGEVPFGLDEIERAIATCSHFVAIGTSGMVWPASGLLVAARRLGATTWVQAVDRPANLDTIDRFRPGRAAAVVPTLLDELAAELGVD